jgi:hypothetical protein
MSQREQAQTPQEEGAKENVKESAISSLLSSSDPLVKLVTLGMIVFTGAGNFWATNQSNDEINRTLQEVHYIRSRIDYFESRQVDMSNRVKAIDDHVVDIQEKQKRMNP